MSTTKVSAALMESGTKGADISSASSITIGLDGSYFDITGTVTIATMVVDAGRIFTLQFDGAVTLTHSSTLYLAGAVDFVTEANDHLTFVAVAANDVRQIGAGLKDGGSPVAAAGSSVKVGNTTRAIGTTGTQTISGIGFTPKGVMVIGCKAAADEFSVGMSNSTTDYSMYANDGLAADTWQPATHALSMFEDGGTTNFRGVIGNFVDGAFDIVWSETGSASGTCFFSYLVIG
jgi:hypothetical protein